MIVAFHESTTLTADRSRSEQLSEGIYTALVTTLAGLVVAIPAAVLALYLENRLGKLFRRVEKLAFDIAPAVAQFHGRRRMDANGIVQAYESPTTPPPVDTNNVTPPPRETGTSAAQIDNRPSESGVKKTPQPKKKERGGAKAT